MSDRASTFLALWPPPALRRTLAARARVLAVRGRVAPADLHLTLLYLGRLDPGERRAAARLLAGFRFPATGLVLDRLGSFARGRVLWAGPGVLPPGLVLLHHALAGAGFPRGEGAPPPGVRESGPFRPHVTLARGPFRGQTGPLDPPLPWTATRLVLAARLPGGRGVYRRLARRPLGTWPVPAAGHNTVLDRETPPHE